MLLRFFDLQNVKRWNGFSTPFIALSSPMSALQRLKRLHAQQKELQEGKEPNPKEQPLFHLKITHKVPPKNSFKVCHKSE